MRTIRKYLLAACLIVVGSTTICSSAVADTIADSARAVAWTDDNLDTLRRVFPDVEKVNAFLLSLFPDLDPQPKVGEYSLVDLHRDGKVELVVTVAFSRAFYNHLYIVTMERNQFHTSQIFTGGAVITDLKSSIVDLNGDGQKELLLPRDLAPYAGANPIPVITDVYAWNGRRYEVANTSYVNYYRDTVLPRLHAALDRVEKGQETKDPQATEALKEKYRKEIEAVNAIVGQ